MNLHSCVSDVPDTTCKQNTKHNAKANTLASQFSIFLGKPTHNTIQTRRIASPLPRGTPRCEMASKIVRASKFRHVFGDPAK